MSPARPSTPSRTKNENEKYDPSLPLAFKIAQVFELTIEEIFEYSQGNLE